MVKQKKRTQHVQKKTIVHVIFHSFESITKHVNVKLILLVFLIIF